MNIGPLEMRQKGNSIFPVKIQAKFRPQWPETLTEDDHRETNIIDY
jgi:hypothetical protein